MDEERLFSLLVGCSARVMAGGEIVGTALLVAPGLALTCGHVVDDIPPDTQATCRFVVDRDSSGPSEAESAFTVKFPDDRDKSADLALLCLETIDPRQRCACLAQGLFSARELVAFGYPAAFPDGDSLKFEPEFFTGKSGWQAVKLAKGQPSPGHSGSGLLNTRTKAVCGILYSRDDPRAGTNATRAVPIEYAFQYWPEINQRAAPFHAANPLWRDFLPHNRIALDMAVARERMIRNEPHVADLLVDSPLESLWRDFIDSEPWRDFIVRQLSVIRAHAGMLGEENAISGETEAVGFGNACEDAIPALRRIATQDRLKRATDVRKRLQGEYDRLRNQRSPDPRAPKPDTRTVDEVRKELNDARALADALWTLNGELAQPTFQRAFLVMGSLGAGKSHFLGRLLAPESENAPIVVPIGPDDLPGAAGESLLARLSAVTGVEWTDLADAAELLGGTQPRPLIFALDDFHELLKRPREWLTGFIDLIRRHSGLKNIGWILMLDEAGYYLLRRPGEEREAEERRFWNEYGFSGVRRFSVEARRNNPSLDEHESPTLRRAGAWLSLDFLNTSEKTGVELLKALYAKQDPSQGVLVGLLDTVAPGQVPLLSNPWIAWILWDIRKDLPPQTVVTLNYIEFVEKFWARHKLRVQCFDPQLMYRTVGAVAAYIAGAGGTDLLSAPLLEFIVAWKPELSDRGVVKRIVQECLQAEDLLRLERSADEGDDEDEIVRLRFPVFWAWKTAERVLRWEELANRQQDQWRARLKPLVSADRFGIDRDAIATFILLLLDAPDQRRKFPDLAAKTWSWMERLPDLRASVWLAAGKAQPKLQKTILDRLLSRPPKLSADDVRGVVALLYLVQAAHPDAVGYGKRFEILRPHYNAIAKIQLGEYFLLSVHRAMENIGETGDLISALVAFGGSEDIRVSEQIGEASYGALRRIVGSSKDCVPFILRYLAALSEEDRIPEQPERYFYQCFLTSFARDYVVEESPEGFWYLREMNWYRARSFVHPIPKEMAKEMNFAYGHWWRTTHYEPRLNAYVQLLDELIDGKGKRDRETTRRDREAAFFLIRHTAATGGLKAVRVSSRFRDRLAALHEDPLLFELRKRYEEFYKMNLGGRPDSGDRAQ